MPTHMPGNALKRGVWLPSNARVHLSYDAVKSNREPGSLLLSGMHAGKADKRFVL